MKNRIVVDKYLSRLDKDTEPIIITIKELPNKGFGKILAQYLRFTSSDGETSDIYQEAKEWARDYAENGINVAVYAEYVEDETGEFVKVEWKRYDDN